MKTIPFLLFFAALTIISSHFSSVLASAEKVEVNEGCFSQFNVEGGTKNVCLTWSVSSPEVKQFVIERSFDGDYYDTISAMNCNGTATHRFDDATSGGKTAYYRITAVKADATVEKSTVETIKPAQNG